MPEYLTHPQATLFDNPEDRHCLLAPDLEDPAITWIWPNEPGGWLQRKHASESPRDLNAKQLPAEWGVHSGWDGCRELTPTELADRRAEKKRAVAREGRPAHRPPLAYDQKTAHVHLRVTNGDVLRWSRAAAIDGLTLEDWLLKVLRGVVDDMAMRTGSAQP